MMKLEFFFLKDVLNYGCSSDICFTLPFLPTEQMQPEKLWRFPPVSPGPQSEEKGKGEEGCTEVKAGTKKKN